LAARACGPIEAAGDRFVAANDGTDLATAGLDGDERRLRAELQMQQGRTTTLTRDTEPDT